MAARAAVRGVVRAVARSVVGEIGNTFATLAIQGAYPAPTVGVAYSQGLPIVGGSGTYSAPAFIGVAPDGLSLSVVGTDLVLSGTATNGGPFDFNVSVFDATNGWRAFSAQGFTVIVPDEHIQNGDFSAGFTGWTLGGLDWDILGAAGVGTPGTSELVNTLLSPVQSGADITAFRFDIVNGEPSLVSVILRNSGTSATCEVYLGTADAVGVLPTQNNAGAGGPYDELVINNVNGVGDITVDNFTLIT